MSEVNPTDPTQVSYPWKTTVRTVIQTFIAAAGVLALAAPMLQEFVEQFWPGSPIIAWIGIGAAFIAALAGLVTRIMAIEGVNALLTKVGLGATPR